MIDRELLELAAKAYGIELDYRHGSNAYYYDDPDTGREQWNPLDDDGQALRMAVKLGMVIDVRYTQQEAFRYNRITFWIAPSSGQSVEFEDVEIDPLASTRRAIVRAAAEIGRAM